MLGDKKTITSNVLTGHNFFLLNQPPLRPWYGSPDTMAVWRTEKRERKAQEERKEGTAERRREWEKEYKEVSDKQPKRVVNAPEHHF